MTTPNKYRIMEHFHTLQGEGYYTGRSAYFIRLSGCDVGCVWCDVKESWDPEFGTEMSLDDLKDCVGDVDFVVITGGEPTMHDLNPLTEMLHEQGKTIAIETSGCYSLNGKVDWYVFSPKKFKAPLEEAYRLAQELKVVVNHPSDLTWANNHAQKVNKDCLLYLQPEWTKSESISPQIIEFVKSNPKWRISLQTHKFLNIP